MVTCAWYLIRTLSIRREQLVTDSQKCQVHVFPPYEKCESFGQNYPEDFDGTLDCVSIAITCAFNRQGTILAVGCNDGRLVLWDFLTRGIAKIINAHVHPVCTLSWSRNGRKLLSAATDNTVSLWDVLTGEVEKTFRFPSPILKVQFHPRSSEKFLVCPMKHAAVTMDMEGSHKLVPLDEDSDLNIMASYDRRGKCIYTGNAKGRVCVFTEEEHKLKASFRVTTGTLNTTAIKSIEFARRGDCFLVNSADRVIRVYESGEILACGKDGEPEPIQKLQDLVNKTMWKKCCFSGDGEYIVAGSAKQHSLYIWEKSVGNLVKILHGTKGELLLDVAQLNYYPALREVERAVLRTALVLNYYKWHPVRPIIASISSGVVSVWAQNQVENWSAFAPDFKELDENVEYDERESEFDIEEEGKEKEDFKEEEEDVEVDVTTVNAIQAFVSSDEEEEDTEALMYLPVAPEIDEPEEGWPVVSEMPQHVEETQSRPEKRKNSQQTPDFTKKSKLKPFDVDLENAPSDEIHPLLNVKKPNEKVHKKPSTKTKQKSGKSDRSKHKGD